MKSITFNFIPHDFQYFNKFDMLETFQKHIKFIKEQFDRRGIYVQVETVHLSTEVMRIFITSNWDDVNFVWNVVKEFADGEDVDFSLFEVNNSCDLENFVPSKFRPRLGIFGDTKDMSIILESYVNTIKLGDFYGI